MELRLSNGAAAMATAGYPSKARKTLAFKLAPTIEELYSAILQKWEDRSEKKRNQAHFSRWGRQVTERRSANSGKCREMPIITEQRSVMIGSPSRAGA
ncbi:hypothetical protein SD70_23440 [Gordoniibacillus kamchatkensis]|uniref:Uncharacterized protein n=1 Tax=Gordoniibacillus kamchatkensis TaxID=1590651 RepID=A0ABR5ACY3_9BACL|nr:hypothetical protein [Paenibacillus sp. VKM B-2647]KIL38910.1 hypothetical protein SD70_23440 [Paenibacillus sp. VKM B-2647]